MLKDALYTIQKIAAENNTIEVGVVLNAAHAIFKGHFPSQPVLPGACMLQMVKEIMEIFFKKELQLTKAEDMRFSAVVNPDKNKELKFSILYNIGENQSININTKIIRSDDVVCCKMKASFKEKN